MSLINDMLRNLDQQGRAQTTVAAHESGSQGLVKHRRNSWLPAVGAFIVVATLVLLLPRLDIWRNAQPAAAEAILTPDDAGIAEHEDADLDLAPVASVDIADEPLPTVIEIEAEELTVIEIPARVKPAPEQNVAHESAAHQNQEPAPQEPAPVEKNAQVHVVPTPEWLDQVAAEEAVHLLAIGQEASAVSRLQTAVSELSAPAKSTAMLIDLYREQGRFSMAHQLLQRSDYLGRAEQNYLSAQLLLAEGQGTEARYLLETHVSSALEHEGYRALLAGLQQRDGAYWQAANQYRRLLTDFGDRPVYWLGLALALDAQGESLSALEAYRRARAEQLPDVRAYIDQRIAVLAP